jgi:hypothetical protein
VKWNTEVGTVNEVISGKDGKLADDGHKETFGGTETDVDLKI